MINNSGFETAYKELKSVYGYLVRSGLKMEFELLGNAAGFDGAALLQEIEVLWKRNRSVILSLTGVFTILRLPVVHFVTGCSR